MTLASTVTKSAARAVKAYGAKGTLTHVVPGGYDPATGTTTGAVTTVVPCSAVLDQSSVKTLGWMFGDGLIQGGEMLALVTGALAVQGDVLTVLGGDLAGQYAVIKVRVIPVGSTVVASECLVRR